MWTILNKDLGKLIYDIQIIQMLSRPMKPTRVDASSISLEMKNADHQIPILDHSKTKQLFI